jgi:hypothetical protein
MKGWGQGLLNERVGGGEQGLLKWGQGLLKWGQGGLLNKIAGVWILKWGQGLLNKRAGTGATQQKGRDRGYSIKGWGQGLLSKRVGTGATHVGEGATQ